jgi:hypothetical protein
MDQLFLIVPKRWYQTNLRKVKTQKTEELKLPTA